MSRYPLFLVLSLALFLLHGCGGFSRLIEPAEPLLADLESATLPPAGEALPAVGLDELADIYRDVLGEQQTPEVRTQVQHRLADIEMLSGEARLAEPETVASGQVSTLASTTETAPFDAAITGYETLLAENPEYEGSDKILYQLSKAYDMRGESDKSQAILDRLVLTQPQSEHVLEANFRRAERYFIDAQYARAEETYTAVIAHGEGNPYYTRALYMQGWARFKQDRLEEAIPSFTLTLDELVPANNHVGQLARGEREMVQDCLRVMAVVFSNLEGTDTIASAYASLGVRSYQHLLYESLGMLYLSQERFRDSAQTYQTFSITFPDSTLAHRFALRVIEAYEAGNFRDLIIDAKASYVSSFSVFNDYWRVSEMGEQEVMSEHLQQFIDELARHHHSLAQALPAQEREAAAVHYASAADYYQLYLQSFPQDSAVPQIAFLLAESRFEAGDYAQAIASYEWVAYEFSDFEKSADAGYGAILAHAALAKASDAAPEDVARRARIDSELRFAATFADTRALAVLGRAASDLLQMQNYLAAREAATALIEWPDSVGAELMIPAWLVVGHSDFEVHDFSSAEQAYVTARGLMKPDDSRYGDTVERVAASIYRQAEIVAERGDDADAAREFERVMTAAPDSKIRANAQFDAASAYIRAGELEQANGLLVDFRQRYPGHELTASIAPTLLGTYEVLEQWSAAAAELELIEASAVDETTRREALYLAAQYYDKAGDVDSALQRYRSYAHNWPQPLAQNMESMDRLARIYEQGSQRDKQAFWLEKLRAAHDGAGRAQTPRSSYLAAYASSVLANSAFDAYAAIKLNLPLKASLRRKKQAMEAALAAYEKTHAYGVEQFSTLATFRMASVYQQLSLDLMASQRPVSLDALALEHYELMLEEQAFPFEETAIAIHESNARRSWDDVYDEWVQQSFTALAQLSPGRYRKEEAEDLAEAGLSQEGMEGLTSPNKVQRLNRSAIALREQGNFAAAEQAYLEALVVYEPHAATHRNLGILYDLYRGEREKALRHFSRYQALTHAHDRVVKGWIADLERRQVAVIREVF